MSDPPDYDQHLLDRLNALKASNIQLNPLKPHPLLKEPSREATPESDLSARLRSLRNDSLSPYPGPKSPRPTPTTEAIRQGLTEDPDPFRTHLDSDDRSLEELLAEIGPEEQWTLNPDEPDEIQKLLDEAKTALPPTEDKRESPAKDAKDASPGDSSKSDKTILTRDLDMSAFALDEEDKDQNRNQKLEDESREIQDIVAKLMDEVELERANEPENTEEMPEEDEEGTGDEKELSELSLPSPPAKLPDLGKEPDKRIKDFESDIAARMAALRAPGGFRLPSVPTSKPTSLSSEERMKKYTDEEIETWCVICQSDATIKCLGCDGDLYCALCWREGHVGPDVGWEERTHKWVKYKKPN